MELEDDFLARRYGWTFSQLDEEDMSRVLPSVAAANIHAALTRIYGWLDAAGRGANVPWPSDDDLRIQRIVADAQREANA